MTEKNVVLKSMFQNTSITIGYHLYCFRLLRKAWCSKPLPLDHLQVALFLFREFGRRFFKIDSSPQLHHFPSRLN